MITCSICGTRNDDLATVCTKCRSYIQAKVDTLDLFATFWGLIEAPWKTFRRIVLARQKNYVVLLTVLFGITLSFSLLSILRMGTRIDSVGVVLLVGILSGPILGLLVAEIAGLLSRGVGRIVGGTGVRRNLRAVFAFSMMPVLFLLMFVFPVEFGIFGRYLFDHNPPPSVINPPLHYSLLAFEVVGAVWAFVLYAIGNAVAHGIPWLKGVLVALAVVVPLAGIVCVLRFL